MTLRTGLCAADVLDADRCAVAGCGQFGAGGVIEFSYLGMPMLAEHDQVDVFLEIGMCPRCAQKLEAGERLRVSVLEEDHP